MRKCSVGGQGVVEGVMMRSPELLAIAVRKESGQIIYKKKTLTPLSKKNKFFGWPIVRGVVSFVDSLVMGVGTISDSAKMYDEEAEGMEPNKFEQYVAKKTNKSAFDVMMYFAVAIALVIGVGLFFVLPTYIANFVRPFVSSSLLMNLIEGVIRLIIFLCYITAISLIKDIRRVYQYHGAEHKTIHCYENEEPLDTAHIQKYSTLHPRCGTSYLFLVMAVAIVIYAFLGWSSEWYLRFGLRILMLPVVAGVAYEILKLAAKYENWLTRAVRAPGLAIQKLTTRQPDDTMVEVALVALNASMGEMSDEDLDAMCASFARGEERKRLDGLEGEEGEKPESKPGGPEAAAV